MFDNGDPVMFEGSEHHRITGPKLREGGVMVVPQVADGGVALGRQGCIARPVSSRAATMLRRADELLSEAAGTRDAAERFQLAYLAALRGAGAVLAVAEVRAGQSVRRTRTRNAWVLMAKADPGFARWADFFADRSATRAAIESGITRTLPTDEADRFYDEVGSFLHEVEDCVADRVAVPDERGTFDPGLQGRSATRP